MSNINVGTAFRFFLTMMRDSVLSKFEPLSIVLDAAISNDSGRLMFIVARFFSFRVLFCFVARISWRVVDRPQPVGDWSDLVTVFLTSTHISKKLHTSFPQSSIPFSIQLSLIIISKRSHFQRWVIDWPHSIQSAFFSEYFLMMLKTAAGPLLLSLPFSRYSTSADIC